MIETVTSIVRNKDLLSAEVNCVTTAKLSEVAPVVFDGVTTIEQTRESDEGTVENGHDRVGRFEGSPLQRDCTF